MAQVFDFLARRNADTRAPGRVDGVDRDRLRAMGEAIRRRLGGAEIPALAPAPAKAAAPPAAALPHSLERILDAIHAELRLREAQYREKQAGRVD